VRITTDLWIGPLGELRKPILAASTPPGENWQPSPYFNCRYAVWRTDPPMTPMDGTWWDADGRLHRCMQLLRLVRPTTIAYQFACQVRFDDSGERIIQPAGVVGQGALAFVSAGNPDGVQEADVGVLRRLINVFDPSLLPNRVKNALWMHEHVAWTRLMNVRWPLVITALEALIHTDDRRRKRMLGSTDQFCLRLEKLQDLMRERLWSTDELQAIYDLRSSFAHGRGGSVDALKGEPLRLYEVAENGLRRILRRAIAHPAIADVFRTDTSIRTTLYF